MSLRPENLVLSGMVMVACWIVGCSASTDDPQEPPPSGTLLPTTPGGPTSGSGTPSTSTANSAQGPGGGVDACIAACEAKYPAAAKLAQAIDACWAKSCSSCENMQQGPLEGPSSGSCKTEVSTPSAACSTCTAQHCCTAWDACFGNADCVALNSCSVACYK